MMRSFSGGLPSVSSYTSIAKNRASRRPRRSLLLLDQGVRTWGDVRLVLAGAAIALARQAQRRRIAIKLATTSNGGEAIDPVQLEPRGFRALVETSDLSAHPGAALLHLLDSPAAARRDIVLLTHPRNLGEPAVRDAARSLAEEGGAPGCSRYRSTRRGSSSWPSCGAVCRSRWDAAASTLTWRPRPPLTPSSSPHLAQRTAWQGDVESIPFPFKCGTLDRIDAPRTDGHSHLDFDEAGERILVIGRHGLLFTWRIDGTDLEILPRPLVHGEVSRNPTTVIGVAGGFVVVSRRQGRLVLAHYDFPTRTCRVHTHVDGETAESWVYYRDLHCVVGRSGVTRGERPGDRPGCAGRPSGGHHTVATRGRSAPRRDFRPSRSSCGTLRGS